MNEERFWQILSLLNWNFAGKDEKVINPAVLQLSAMEDRDIFTFHDIMSGMLYDIDGKKWAENIFPSEGVLTPEDFLYMRCVALVNGKEYYHAVRARTVKLNPDMEFAAVLEIPMQSWSIRHGLPVSEYPHKAKYPIHSGARTSRWK